MKNITLSVDEDVLARVRRLAADRNSTVNALVREYLGNLAAHEDRATRARTRLSQLSNQTKGRIGKKTWSREDLHARYAIGPAARGSDAGNRAKPSRFRTRMPPSIPPAINPFL